MRLKFLSLSIFLLLLFLPVFAAYDAHVVGVKAEFSQPKILIRSVEGPEEVPIQTYKEWVFTYRVLNIYDSAINDLELRNKLGAYLDLALISSSDGDYQQSSNKKGTKQEFTWKLDRLERRKKAVLKVKVSTGVKNGKQMFVNPGEHFLFKKAKLFWIDNLGQKQTTATLDYKILAK